MDENKKERLAWIIISILWFIPLALISTILNPDMAFFIIFGDIIFYVSLLSIIWMLSTTK
ncbi:MAG: hypothetical protein ACFE9T_08800 [Promethearchaeota archaeon]